MSLLQLLAFLPLIIGAYHLYPRYLQKFPPGPRGFPLIGATFSMPKEKEWLAFTEWAKKYGGIIGINAVGKKIVVLNTSELVTELLEVRGAIYSDRPRIPMLDMIGLSDWSVGLMPYGPKLRSTRKLLLKAMAPEMLKKYAHVQEREVYQLLLDLTESPKNFYSHLRRTSGGIMMSIFLGHRVKNGDDKYMALNDEHVVTTSRAGSYAEFVVNVLPPLRYVPMWFPGAGFQKVAKEAHDLSQKIFDLPMELAKWRSDNGHYVPCFMTSVLENGENIAEGQSVAATAYTAGSETTTSTLATFVLAMTLYPEIQRKAQAEVTQVFGTNRLPRLVDRDSVNLPFVEALIKETHRWNPPGNLAVPRVLIKDDIVNGYLIPQGTIVMSNIWAILHDERRYPQPLEFNPERYVHQEHLEDPREHVFGYGRRVCPGRNLAEATVWVAIVSILCTFDIARAHDENGNVIPVTGEYTSGVMCRPKEFRCSITPRDAAVKDRIKQSLESLENLLSS